MDSRKKNRRKEDKRINFRNRRRFDRRMDIEEFKRIIFASKKDTPPEEKRIVITGIGVVAPNGIGKDQFWDNLANGVSGIKPISLFDTAPYQSKLAGEIPDFNPAQYLGRKGLRTLDRSTLLLAVATKLAMEDGQIEINHANTYQTGIVTGTSMGSVKSISEFDKTSLSEGPACVNPAHFPNTVINSPSSHVSIIFDIRGINTTITSGFCSSLDAAVYAYDSIMLNRANIIFTGAVEELSHHTFLGSYKPGCLAGSGADKNGMEQSMPFDRRRNGMVLGEGASVMVFEDLGHARKRGARIYGEVLGFARAFYPDNKGDYRSESKGAISAMSEALNVANLGADSIDLVCSGANASPSGDKFETFALKGVFGKRAYKVPVTAIKSMIGEGYGVSGTFQAIAALLAINKGIIPPTINYEEADPDCDLDYVPKVNRESDVKKVMVNCFSPHGNNTSLIIGKFLE
ncbi:MAG: beta-ketoacyl-[acyl-carrier-protein] synthase family protein [bacterium]